MQATTKLDGLQCGRAVAALMVAVFHANVFLLPAKFYDGQGAGAIFGFGYAGVEFFFVLSGFIMIFVHGRDLGHPDKVGTFLSKRILRIYPIYWIILTVLLLLYVLSPGSGPQHAQDPIAILASYLLFPQPDNGPIMRVAWTLQHEMLFYLIFATLLINLRLGIALSAVWVCGCLAVLVSGVDTAYPVGFILKSHNLLFLFGVAVGAVVRSVPQSMARICFWGGALAFASLGAFESLNDAPLPEAWMPIPYGVASAFIIIGLANGGLPAPRWLTLLGDASYAIYLVHMPTMTIAAVFIARSGLHHILHPLAMLGLILLLVSVVGVFVHRAVEKPLLSYFKRRASPIVKAQI